MSPATFSFIVVGEKAAQAGVCRRKRSPSVQPRIISTSAHMDLEKTIAEIEWLERILALPDTRPLQLPDREAANRRHDEVYAANPWFRLWQRYGIPR